MRHWSQLGIRNWRAKPGRTAGAIGAIALGVGVVIWVTCAYESVRLALRDQVWFWIGHSQLAVESVYGANGTVYQSIADEAMRTAGLKDNIHAYSYRLKKNMVLRPLPPGWTSGPADAPTGTAPASAGAADAAHSPPEIQKEVDWWPTDVADHAGGQEVQAIGIVPERETFFRDFNIDRVAGRMLTPEDHDAAVVDEVLAGQLGLKIGDWFTLQAASLNQGDEPAEEIAAFQVVGLLTHRRVAKTQRPVVLVMLERTQALAGYHREPKRVTKIDFNLSDTSDAAVIRTERMLAKLVERHRQGFLVTSARNKIRQVEAAEQQTQFVLLMISTVALFTAFFIILSTLSMGMVERIGQLGTLRCLGLTRWQVGLLVLGEALPVGLVGIALGVPVGLGLAKLSVWLAPEYIGTFAISVPGLKLAVLGGAATTLAGALLPMLQALRVSPLNASRPQSKQAPGLLAWIAGAAGAAMILQHARLILNTPPNQFIIHPQKAILTVGLLYAGYACLVPLVIRVVGVVAVRVAAWGLRVRHRLLADQVGKAVWRSSAICCGLMVGLSLIVTLVVHSASLSAGWDFPRQFCEAFVYIIPPRDRALVDAARKIPGAGTSALVNTNIQIRTYGKGDFDFPISLFVAGDPEEFFRMARLEFVQGEREAAIQRLKQGGAVLVTPEFVRSKKINFGERVLIKQGVLFGRGQHFEIAGVVTSPALDIAANYFNAGDMLVAAAVHVVMGTFEDANRIFKVPDEASLVLLNFELPETPDTQPPAEFLADAPPLNQSPMQLAATLVNWRSRLPERAEEIDEIARFAARAGSDRRGPISPTLRLFREALSSEAVIGRWSDLAPELRWQAFRQELVMRLIAYRCGSSNTIQASVQALKARIDSDMGRATRLFSSVPIVSLIVAALGVANLMMANVTNRTRQIAMLRAVGATRWQIIRLVIGEAIVLGLLGSAIGIGLGVHAALGMNHLVEVIWGFRPALTIPYGWLVFSISLTLAICLLAGVLPARHAARTQIIDAMRTT